MSICGPNRWRQLTAAVLVVLSTDPTVSEDVPLPQLLFDVRVGDAYEEAASLQGWYDCSHEATQRLCFDSVTMLGQTGRFSVEFLNGKAFVGKLQAAGSDAFSEMVDQLATWRGGQNTLVSLRTTNAEIDVIRAVYEAGSAAAMGQYSRYLTGNGRHLLQSLTFVPALPPSEHQYPSSDAYLDSLPNGEVVLTLSEYRTLATVLYVMPAPNDKKRAFPEYCNSDCSSWAVSQGRANDDLLGWIVRLFR